MEYQIVQANSPAKLAALVTVLLRSGWTCQGGVAIAEDQGSTTYCQAVVKQ